MSSNQPMIIDLFAGAGGLSLGAARAGFKLAGAVEIDKHAIETHKNNFPDTIHLSLDILSLDGESILDKCNLRAGELDGLIGGPPCQGFSSIGQRCPDDSRNLLFTKFFYLAQKMHPRFFIAENVLGILDTRFDNIRNQAFSLVQKDFIMLPPIIIAANMLGAPTIRKRVFFIGYDPKKIRSGFSITDFDKLIVPDEKRTRVQRALLGLPLKAGIGKLEVNISKIAENGSFEHRVSGMIPDGVGLKTAIYDYYEHQMVSGCISTQHSPEIAERYKRLSYGETDRISRSVKLDPNGFCPTLRAGTGPEKGSYQAVRPIHYSEPRVITPREAARLQGFPDWFVFHKTKWHSFRQIGNSVSPIVAEKLLSVLYQKIT